MQDANAANDFFDSVVNSIEAGDRHSALARLSGALDMLVGSSNEIELWRAALNEHRLGQLLGCTIESGSRPSLMVSRQQAEIPAADLFPGSPVDQACATRRQIAITAIGHALDQGRKIVALDEESQAALHAASSPGANRAPIEPLDQLNQDKSRADLVVALQFVSRCPLERLAAGLSQLASIVSPGGRLLLSSFLPFHVGSGWRVLRSGDELHMHNEASLTAAAEDAGLELSSFRESQNTLLWAVAQLRGASTNLEENTHGNIETDRADCAARWTRI